ncbi:MAG: exosome complex RNA-binding protein Rrp4 [Promethearchaeia archaeon]
MNSQEDSDENQDAEEIDKDEYDEDEQVEEDYEENGEYDETQDDAHDEDEEEYEDVDDEDDNLRDIVVPGETLTEDLDTYKPGRGTIINKTENKIISLYIGLKNIKNNYINVIPLRGIYTPKVGDKVIAIVVDKNPVKYKCDINAKYKAQLRPKNTVKQGKFRRKKRKRMDTSKYDLGDVLVAKVISANRLNKPRLTTVGKYLGKKSGGVVINIDPPKIPRVIGRNGSMIKMLKRMTNSNIFVTQNGRIWLKGDSPANERLLIDAINKIQREAHTSGLTDRVQAYIESEKQKRGID